MKRFRILHRTYYNFAAPVVLGEHEIRLRPRASHEQCLESFALEITPAATLRWYLDADNNSVAIASFENQATQQLAIIGDAVVQQHNINPFDFLLADYATQWPFEYSAAEATTLAPYLQSFSGTTPELLSRWLGEDLPARHDSTFSLMQSINERIHRSLSYRLRPEAGVQNPATTLDLGSGACRDFALLFIEAARHMGIAARFVSGYLRSDPVSGNLGSTHAWAEVYLPGAGWKGFDPTSGQLAGPDHFAVATARSPDRVSPVEGSYIGIADSQIDVGVWVSELTDAAA